MSESDILKFIRNEDAMRRDPDGRLAAMDDWSEAEVRAKASAMSIDLSPAHLDVIRFVRAYYLENGEIGHARELLLAMEGRFAKEGGGKYLFRLFPGGPVRQATALAGLPVPADAANNSFGSVQ